MAHTSKTNASGRRLRSSSNQNEHIDAVPPRRIASPESTPVKQEQAALPRIRSSRRTKSHEEEQVSVGFCREDKHPADEDTSITSQPVRKQKREMISPATTLASDEFVSPTQEPSHASKRLCTPTHTILQNVTDFKHFAASVHENNGMPAQQRTLEIHLNASKNDEYADLYLAIALNQIHPRPDGTNPHHFESISLVINGAWLYTRYSYNLASPALTSAVSSTSAPGDHAQHALLRRLAAGGLKKEKKQKKPRKPTPNTPLTKEEKAGLSYKVTSTERLVARALLGIRGVEEVVFAGEGAMEGVFAETLKTTLVQPPGTDVTEPPVVVLSNSTLLVYEYGEGSIESSSYRTKRIAAGSDESELGMDDMVRVRKMEQEKGYAESERHDFLGNTVFPLTDWQNNVEMGWEVSLDT